MGEKITLPSVPLNTELQGKKDIELIEKEKQEYLKNHPEELGVQDDTNESKEEIDVDEMEFSLTKEEIEDWIIKLTELKVEKNPIELEVDEKNSLKINYEEENDTEY